LNCGTGEDAVRFAKMGCKVIATDISGDMLKVAKTKAEDEGLLDKIEFRNLDISKMSEQVFQTKFNLVFSNFGGLNCVDKQSLNVLKTKLNTVLKNEGRFVAVVMPDKCAMETIYFLLKLEIGKAFRRGKKHVNWVNNSGESLKIYYYSPSAFYSNFKSAFMLGQKLPIGLWIPPSYTESFFQRHPRVLKFLSSMEKSFHPSFTSRISDHYLIDLKIKNG
jgi:ubiquinone/menaquinone biosynthesis C-methylase UbiE